MTIWRKIALAVCDFGIGWHSGSAQRHHQAEQKWRKRYDKIHGPDYYAFDVPQAYCEKHGGRAIPCRPCMREKSG